MYLWNLDFDGPLSLTSCNNYYGLIMIKHFSKWLELVSLLDHSNEITTYAFLDWVFTRFDVPIEILIHLEI
jgi:hypothetical protein